MERGERDEGGVGGGEPSGRAGLGLGKGLRPVLRRRGLGALLLLGLAQGVGAWSARSHQEIARRALAGLDPVSRKLGRWHRRSLERGARAPDFPGEGWIPAQYHVLDGREHPRRNMAQVVEDLETWLRESPRRDGAWWFQAGRLSHLIADLVQPMHTDRSPEEGRVHAAYEAWAEALPWGPVPDLERARALPLGDLAIRGRRDYADLVRDFESQRGGPDLARRSREWLDLAVQQTAARWRSLGDPPADPLGENCWGILALAWFGLLERRLRGGVRG